MEFEYTNEYELLRDKIDQNPEDLNDMEGRSNAHHDEGSGV